MQNFSDDATHDEALSSRIAAVNLLDLTLAHLGVDVSDSAKAVDAVVKACGESEHLAMLSFVFLSIKPRYSIISARCVVSCSGRQRSNVGRGSQNPRR